MNDKFIKQLELDNERLREENKKLYAENTRMNMFVEFNRDYIEKAAKLEAIKYIVMTEEYFVKRERLAEILRFQLPEKE